MNRFLSYIAVAAAAAFVGPSMARATIVYDTAIWAAGLTEQSYTLTLDKFDSSLGTLNSVTLYFYAQEDTTQFKLTNTGVTTISGFDVSVTANVVRLFNNTANAADDYSSGAGMTLQLFDTGIGTGLGHCTGAHPNTVQPFNGCDTLTLAGGASVDYASPTPFTIRNTDTAYGLTTGTGNGGVTGATIFRNSSMSGYVSGGPSDLTFNLTGQTKNILSLSGTGGNIDLSQTTYANFAAEVDYDYTPFSSVPEPATMGLMGSALVGAIVFRKRLKK